MAVFLYELIFRHGCTCIQINDQGREFCNAVSHTLLNLTDTKQRVTSAYHPQANGLVERQNRTIQVSMLKVLEGEQERWPDALQGVLLAFRTARHKSTGQTPFEMLYGRKALLPIENEAFPQGGTDAEVITTDESPVDEKKLQEQLSRILNIQSVIHQEAAKSIDKAQKM